MNDQQRERTIPMFLLLSMLLHALLFLIAPQLTAGLLPSFKPGEQGGLTVVTMVETLPPEKPQAAVVEAARRPEAKPKPKEKPEPKPVQKDETDKAEVAPAKTDVEPKPVKVPEVEAEKTAPEPAVDKPASVSPQLQKPQPERVPEAREPEKTATPEEVKPKPAEIETKAAPEEVLTSDQGEHAVPQATAPSPGEKPQVSRTAAEARQGTPAKAERPPQKSSSAPATQAGSASEKDVSSAAPEAAPEPKVPPTGISMVQDFGGTYFPKDAVGMFQGTVEVELAAIVGPDGRVRETVMISSSGIPYIDDYSTKIAKLRVQYKPYDEEYEVRVFVTYNADDKSLKYRAGDYIKSPPTVGSGAE